MNVDTMDTMAWICWEKCTQQKSWHFYHQNVLGFPVSFFFPQRTCAILGKSYVIICRNGHWQELEKTEFRKAWIQGSFFHPGRSSPIQGNSICRWCCPKLARLDVSIGNGLPLKKGQPVLWWINRLFLWTFWPCEMNFRSSSQEHPVRMQTWKARNPWFLVSTVIVMVAEGRVDGLKLSFPRYVCGFLTIYPPVSNWVRDHPLTSTCWFSPWKIGINQLLPFR